MYFPPEERTHWSCRDCVLSTAGPATLRSSVTRLFLGENAGLLTLVCNLKKKNKKLTRNKNMKTVAARLGGDFETGQSFSEFIYRFYEEQASGKLTIAE